MRKANRASAKSVATTGPKLWVVLARAYGAMAAFVEASVAAEGLCLSDFMVLEVLLHKGAMTISGIGEKVLLANASMTAAVDRLEKRGWVERRSSAEDRRIRIVELTDEGRHLIEELYARHALQIEGLMEALDEREREQLRSSLKTLGLAAKTALEPPRSRQIAELPEAPQRIATGTRRKGTRP